MIVCVAEKPSVARDIAAVLGARDRRDGYIEGNGYQITWVFGHLCTLKEPHEYNLRWRDWSLGVLPIVPERFGIKLIDNVGGQKQFRVIEHLVRQADQVINCGDAGQEGELIQRWVLQLAGCRAPVKRLWISSMTDEAIREGFANLKDEGEFQKLYEAGMSRAIGDWLLGMNGTRLFTGRYAQGRQLFSVGRVQTPTLAMIVNRFLEIQNFVPQPYWEVKTRYRNVLFSSTKGRFDSVEEGNEVMASIAYHPFIIKKVGTKEGNELPPSLFDLTSLQVECNRKCNLSADETLKTVQSLYEKKLTTYPRVDTTFLTDDIYPKVKGTLRGLYQWADLTAPLLEMEKLPKSKKVFDNSKVTDHHAIIPTGVRVGGLSANEARVYEMICKRFIAVFYPACCFSMTTVLGNVNTIEFKTTGKQILNPGWRLVYQKDPVVNDTEGEEHVEEEGNSLLPDFVANEQGPHEPSIAEKATQPPKNYTEATLLRAMETAGKSVEDEELRHAMKENGIGRPSTRAAIIETLLKRDYIRKERKTLLPTDIGIRLIQSIRNDLLKSPTLTGQWEKKLRDIEKGAYDTKLFHEELKQMVVDLVRDELYPAPAPVVELICPQCGVGHIVKGRTAYGCDAFRQGCAFRLLFDTYGDSLTVDQLAELLKRFKQ